MSTQDNRHSSMTLLPENSQVRKRPSDAALGNVRDKKRRAGFSSSDKSEQEASSAKAAHGTPLMLGHVASGSPNEIELSQPLIYGQVFEWILRLIEAPFVGFVLHFITKLTSKERLLLFCSSKIIPDFNLFGIFEFTADKIDKVASLYQQYTRDDMPPVQKTLKKLLRRLVREISQQMNQWAMDAEKHVLVDFTGANIKEKWVDYLVVKLLKMDHCDLEELQDKHWEQVAIGHTIMAGKCSASSVKACYERIELGKNLNDVERVLLQPLLPCPESSMFGCALPQIMQSKYTLSMAPDPSPFDLVCSFSGGDFSPGQGDSYVVQYNPDIKDIARHNGTHYAGDFHDQIFGVAIDFRSVGEKREVNVGPIKIRIGVSRDASYAADRTIYKALEQLEACERRHIDATAGGDAASMNSADELQRARERYEQVSYAWLLDS